MHFRCYPRQQFGSSYGCGCHDPAYLSYPIHQTGSLIEVSPYSQRIHPSNGYFHLRTFPKVDPASFHASANVMQSLMADAGKIVNTIAASDSYATEILDAAQKSNQQKVDQLLSSVGVDANLTTSFNPDSITIHLASTEQKNDCCVLSLSLRWG